MAGGIAAAYAGVTRRDVLRAGSLGAMSLAAGALPALAAGSGRTDRAVILLLLVGGPSQLETFDPKPDAPDGVRGPFGSIATAVPGVRVCEHLPRLARRLDRVSLIRSLYHDAAPIHETGHQLLQTGRLCRLGEEHPHVGAVATRLRGARGDAQPFVVLPGPIGNTGVNVSHGQTAGRLGPDCEPRPSGFVLKAERESVRDAYGRHHFGQDCLRSCRLVEQGARVVTVNMFPTVFDRVTWDCHGARPFSTLDDYARELLPVFDQAFSALLDDLDGRRLLDTTLVVATGEFGRTPRLNASGGRDHWPGVWSAVVAGGGTKGGQVIGASDAHAVGPIARPVTPAELVATMYRSLGIDTAERLALDGGESITLADGARPVGELFS